jgi:DNA-binding IclR family transcriptional regulator
MLEQSPRAAGDGPSNSSARPAPAVLHAVRIIDYLEQVKVGAGVSEIARALAMNKSTCFNILIALATAQVVTKDSRHAVYRLGPRLVEWGNASRRQFSSRTALREEVQALVADIGLTCLIGQVLADHRGVVVVDRVEPQRASVSTLPVGSVVPLSGPAMGRAVLAFLDEPEALAAARAAGLLAAGGEQDLLDDLAAVRAAGYATSEGQFEPGVHAVATAVTRARVEIVCVLCVIGFERDLPSGQLDPLGARLVRLGRELDTAALG